jgi:signal transduction histidine kinase
MSSLRLRLALAIAVAVGITGIAASWIALSIIGVAPAGPAALGARALLEMLGFALGAVAAMVLLMDLVAWPLVHRPIQQLRQTIERVTAGDFSARVPITRHDELGEVAEGLNRMLEQLETLNNSLETRVRESAEEVQQRNRQLVESYRRHFALREQLANAEQLASVGQTAANVAHQVGTPLNLISGYVQLLKEELGPGSRHNARLAIIEEQIAKVTTTVRTLLDRSRPMGRKTRTVAAAPGPRVRIEVSDTGHGIPADLLPRIFEPWVSTKKPGRGTGLGLAIARDVVTAHGGTLTVDSTVGVGTTFTIELPSEAARDAGRAAS